MSRGVIVGVRGTRERRGRFGGPSLKLSSLVEDKGDGAGMSLGSSNGEGDLSPPSNPLPSDLKLDPLDDIPTFSFSLGSDLDSDGVCEVCSVDCLLGSDIESVELIEAEVSSGRVEGTLGGLRFCEVGSLSFTTGSDLERDALVADSAQIINGSVCPNGLEPDELLCPSPWLAEGPKPKKAPSIDPGLDE